MQTIPLPRLALIGLPVLLVLAVLFHWRLAWKNGLYALTRMLLQLILIGYTLVYLFRSESSPLVLLVLAVMLLSASWIALRTVPDRRRSLLSRALLAVSFGGGSILIIVSQGVLALDPWFHPRYLIPLAGMIFASAMNSVSLGSERFFAERSRGLSSIEARNIAFEASLIPIMNSLFAVGLVSIPGMMTGQVLSGVAPPIAARYQIMVMGMIFSAAGLSSALFLALAQGTEASEVEPSPDEAESPK